MQAGFKAAVICWLTAWFMVYKICLQLERRQLGVLHNEGPGCTVILLIDPKMTVKGPWNVAFLFAPETNTD